MTFRPILLALAALSLAWALFLWWHEPLREQMVFVASSEPIELTGVVSPYTTPRGVARVRLTTTNGKVYFTDCLAMKKVRRLENYHLVSGDQHTLFFVHFAA